MSDSLSETTSENAEMDVASNPDMESTSNLGKTSDLVNLADPMSTSGLLGDLENKEGIPLLPLTKDSRAADLSGDMEGLMKPPLVAASLAILEVKTDESTVEAMPPTPPPSETHEVSPSVQRSPEPEVVVLPPIRSPIKNRVVCQCGAKNCRGFLY